ncbi:kinase-like domain-containing protein [Linnemannia elongata]|nr:kinase-like domain-containing protein [Linnemannia elongata]
MDIQHEVTMLKAADGHTHLVEYLGIIEDPIGPCILFELCLSNNLNSLLSNRGAITEEEETRYFCAQIATGLGHLRDRDFIHCDLRPENILFASGMRVRIGHLGLAERFDPKRRNGSRAGVDGFRAPEIIDLTPHTRTTYPTKLERALEKGECKLKPDAKGLVRLVLDFDSKNRPQLTSLRRQKFFKLGYCPTILSEDVFQGKPDLTTDGKLKAIPSESEQKVYTKTK